MSYTAPQYVDTKEQAVLALASTIKGEAVTGGDGSVNRALDVLADVLAEQDVQVPQTDAGAILALAQYVSGGGGGSSDFSTATITLTTPDTYLIHVVFPSFADYGEGEAFSMAADASMSGELDMVLYKGACNVDITIDDGTDPSQFSFSSTGNIEQVDGAGSFIATGDCAITITNL